MENEVINVKKKLELFSDLWSQKIIARLNNYEIKLVKIKEEFVWHKHEDTDEMFFVVSGKMTIEFKEEKVRLNEGDLYVVPRGTDHKPYSDEGCSVMVIEPKGVVNTGDVQSDLTAKAEVWI